MAVELSTSDILGQIRYDPVTKKGSVLDVIQLVTNCAQKHSTVLLNRINEKFSDIREKISCFKFCGQGQRPTPVADFPTLFRIMAVLPGSRAKNFRKASMDVFCRAFGADLTFIDELVERSRCLKGTRYDGISSDIHTTVDDAINELVKPLENPLDEGILYIATSPFQSFIKVGYWTGTKEALRHRYSTYYGSELQMWTWECTECRACERFLMDAYNDHNMGGELFNKTCLDDMKAHLDEALTFVKA